MEETINLMCDKDCYLCSIFDECEGSLKSITPESIIDINDRETEE